MAKKRVRKSLTFNIVGALILLLLMFGSCVSIIGYYKFTQSLTNEYTDAAFRTANTAATLVNADNIEKYLAEGGESADYKTTLSYLNILCDKQGVSLVYVIAVDTTDYLTFRSVFNCVSKDSGYTPWPVGLVRNTTNEEYQKIYKQIYEDGLEKATIVRAGTSNSNIPHITSLIPLKSKTDGTVKAILCIQRPMEHLANGRRSYMYLIGAFTVFMIVVTSVAYASFTRRNFIKPIRKITKEAERFAAENSLPNENVENGAGRIWEISTLASSIGSMERDTVKYIDAITNATAEKEKMSAELGVAAMIQKGDLPSVFPPFPDRNEFDIYASMTPAKEVGGDFYDFFFVDDDHLALVMADVSGKGVPASLFMMVSKILIKERALMGGTPSEVLSFVNKRICESNNADMFVTVWLGLLDVRTGKIIAANAGHENPVICKSDGEVEIIKNKHGVPVGAMETAKFTDFELTLGRGDKLFLYTDGVPEATNSNEEMFNMDRTKDVIKNTQNEEPKEVVESVWKNICDFVGDAPQFDDVTMLCIKYLGSDAKTMTVPATVESLDGVIEFIDSFFDEAGASMKTKMQMETAAEEIFVNIAHYAYPSGQGDATVVLSKTGDGVAITFIDSGNQYDPLGRDDPDTTLSAEQRNIGGLGIFMAKKLSDDIKYEYKDGKNVLTMFKKI